MALYKKQTGIELNEYELSYLISIELPCLPILPRACWRHSKEVDLAQQNNGSKGSKDFK